MTVAITHAAGLMLVMAVAATTARAELFHSQDASAAAVVQRAGLYVADT